MDSKRDTREAQADSEVEEDYYFNGLSGHWEPISTFLATHVTVVTVTIPKGQAR